ncbi:MAG: glycerol-3-phosphate dehydrogenase [Spirulinaceae cyanobacterium]
MKQPYFDIIVIGGGINGAGIARDAQGRGLSVYLCEKDDLASATSSASSKLIHGGLRYLEYYEFSLVRKALKEREVLLAMAPHIIWPLRFILPHNQHQRPAWLIRLGLFLYDHLAKRKVLSGSKQVNLHKHTAGNPLQDKHKIAFAYSDCWVQDARLTVLNAVDAQNRGATIETRTECLKAQRVNDLWEVTVRDTETGQEKVLLSKAIVNATGPWVASLMDEKKIAVENTKQLRLVKGSHIVTKKLFDHNYCYIFQNDDGRIVFAIPYESDYTLIGTTEVDYQDDPGKATPHDAEKAYLCEVSNDYFQTSITPQDIIWSYAGVRPLFDDAVDDASAATRDYVFDIQDVDGKAPILSIFGGKITTFRRLAESAVEQLSAYFDHPAKNWTATAPLPGGDLDGLSFDAFVEAKQSQYSWASPKMIYRLCREYGSCIDSLLAGCSSVSELGEHFGHNFYEAEANYLATYEFAKTADDILWRRSKLGLHLTIQERERFRSMFEKELAKSEQ